MYNFSKVIYQIKKVIYQIGAAGENLEEIRRRRRKIGENEKLYEYSYF